MLGGLVIALVLALWGAQAVVPWRLRAAGEEPRRRWAYGALPLLLTALLAALVYLRARPDAAFAAGLTPLLASLPGRLLALLSAALLACDLVLALGRGRLESQGWPIAAAFGLAWLAAASFAAELLRVGEGPSSSLAVLLLAAACRLLVTLGAGELLAPGRPLLALAAGIALPLYFLLLPAELRHPLAAAGGWLPLAAAALLFAAARFLPASLRRLGLAAAVLLAGVFLAWTADLSQALAGRPLPPLPPLGRP
jgi:hypothetical protein